MPTKSEFLKIRVSTSQKEKWQRGAVMRARPLSEFVREACDNHADRVINQTHIEKAQEKLEERSRRREAVSGKRSFQPDWK